jgi:hypothetical protein
MRTTRNPAKQTYTWVDVLLASPAEPMAVAKRTHQLTTMYQGLRALELDASPTREDWCVCTDAVNLLETLIAQGHMQDAGDWLKEATYSLAMAGKRHRHGQRIGLTAQGITAIRECLESYSQALEILPARVMVSAYLATDRRLKNIQSGKRKSHDVEVIAL